MKEIYGQTGGVRLGSSFVSKFEARLRLKEGRGKNNHEHGSDCLNYGNPQVIFVHGAAESF